MKSDKVVITLTDFQQNLLVNGMNEFRNALLMQDLPTEDVDELLLKIIDAPPQRVKRRDYETER